MLHVIASTYSTCISYIHQVYTYFVKLIKIAIYDGVIGKSVLRSRSEDDVLGKFFARRDFGALGIVRVNGPVVNSDGRPAPIRRSQVWNLMVDWVGFTRRKWNGGQKKME